MTRRIERLLSPALRQLQAYHVQDAAGMVKLDAMENPFGWPPELESAWLEQLKAAEINRYPDGAAVALRESLRAALGIPQTQQIMPGNGSDELIQLLCLAVSDAPARRSGRPVLMAPEPGFAMYRQIAVGTGLDYVGVPLLADTFSLDMPAMLAALDRHRPELLFLAYPNNPTGNLFAPDQIESLIEASPGLVIIDEAYQPFAQTSLLPLLDQYSNVLLLRTLSKLGLAGIRLGMLIGDSQWLAQLDKLRLPYNINSLTQITARFVCRHIREFERQAAVIRRERAVLSERLQSLSGLQVYRSDANFILFKSERVPGDEVFQQLLFKKILIKNPGASHPLLKDCLRVTVGTPEENNRFMAALEEAVL